LSLETKANRQSFGFFLDTEALEPTAPLVLTKLLASAFTIHGNHFTVLKHLHPNDAQDFHTESIEAAFIKIATYVSQERKASKKEDKGRYAKKRAQVLTIFKCLIQLLGPVNGRGALNIKSEMENGLREIGIEVSGNRMWEGYRAYEKRLVLIASKDSNIRAGAARVVEEQEQEVEREGTEVGSPTPRATEEVEVELPDLDDEEEVDPAEGMDFDLGDLGNGDEEEEGPVTPSNGKRRSVAGSERPNKKSRK
jgi:cohesin complex subunit SA-1/2